MKEFRVVIKASCEDTLMVIANSEEEAMEKVKNEVDEYRYDVLAYDCDDFKYVGGYTTEPIISVEGWREIKAV